MSNYLITTEHKPIFDEELTEDIKSKLENFYLNAHNEDRIGLAVPMSWKDFTEIIKQSRLDMASINLVTDKIHQMRTFNNGIITIICQDDLTEQDKQKRYNFLKGLQFTQVSIFGLELLNEWLVANICSRVRVKKWKIITK